MTTAEIVPTCALAAAIGVLVLLVAELGIARIAGLALLAAGSAPVVSFLSPTLERAVEQRPVLATVGAVGAGSAVLLLALLAVRRPWLIPVAAVLVGWLRVPLGTGGEELNLLLPLYGVIAAGVLAELWRIVRRRGLAPRLGLVGWALGIYVVLAAASLYWTADLERGATDLLAFYLPFGVLAALLGGIPLGRRPLALMTAGQVGLAVAFAGVALYQWQARELFTNPKVIYVNAFADYFRVNSVFYDPSIYGRFAALAILVAVGVLVLARPARLHLLLVPAALAAFGGLWLSYSQSSFAALGAGLVLLALLAWGWRAGGVLLLLVALGLAAAAALPATRQALSENADRVTSGRADLVERGVDVFREHPVFGAGLGSFGTAAGSSARDRDRLRSHTAPIAVASELGAMGLATLVALAIGIALAARRARRHGPEPAAAGIMLVLVFAIGVHSLAYNALFEDPATWALAAWLALLAASAPSGDDAAPAREPVPAGGDA